MRRLIYAVPFLLILPGCSTTPSVALLQPQASAPENLMTPSRPLKPLAHGGDLGATILEDLGIARANGQQLDDLIGWERARVAKP